MSGLASLDLAYRGAQAVIAVGYHGTPLHSAERLSTHFALYSAHFQCLSENEVLQFLGGNLRLRRTGIVISFDDGLRSHGEVAAPLLERYGLRGWFMVPGGFLDEPEQSQPSYFRKHIRPDGGEEQFGMTWATIRTLAARGHAIGCHTWTHRPLGQGTPVAVLREEISEAKDRLCERIGREVQTFCWPRGRVTDYSAAAHRMIVRTYDLGLMTLGAVVRPSTSPHAIQRFNVEANDSIAAMRFQISRLNELWFSRRRSRVARTIVS